MRMLPSPSPRFVCTLTLTLLLATLVGCGDDTPADPDGGAPDAAAMDAGPSCPGTELRCGSGCVDVQTDPAHCGGCDAACTSVAGAIPTCSAGECVIACESGYADCNALAADGCEAQLASDDAHCGACGEACVAGTCGEGVCAVTWAYALGSWGAPGLPLEGGVVEIRDLASGALAHSIALPVGWAWSLAVAPDGLVVYVAVSTDEVLVIDVITETITGRIPLPSVSDLVLSSDGASLYAAGDDLYRIDTTTSAVTTLTVPGDAHGIALSPDGATLGATGWDGAPTGAALHLVDTATFAEAQLVPLVGSVAGCTPLPNDVKITSSGRALLWDNNCDVLYQVDVATRTQLATVLTGRDSGSFGFASNLLQYDEATARAYVSKESGELLVIDPVAGTFAARSDLGPQPTFLALTPDRAELYVVTGTRPSVLGRITLADDTFTPSVLTLAHPQFTVQLTIAVAR